MMMACGKREKLMQLPQKYYEEIFFNSGDNRQLLPQNQDAIIRLLDKNGAVGIVGMYDEPEYPIYFISGFALTAIGYSYDDMMKISEGRFLNLVYEKDRETFAGQIRNENVQSHEFRMVRKSGQIVWVRLYCQDAVSIDGKPIIISSVRVVDDAKKRENELWSALTKGYNRIIYVDVRQGRYRLVKSEESVYDEQICGTLSELEEFLCSYSRDYVDPEDQSFEEILNWIRFLIEHKEHGGNYQTAYRAKIDGEYQWVQFQAFYGGAMNLDAGHVILTFRVINEEKKRELETNKILTDSLAAAEEAGHVKNKFLSRMSHDLRTPINAIIGMLEIAKKNHGDPAKVDECMEKISVSCENLLSLIQDVLDMNSLQSGRMELMKEQIQLPELLEGELASTVQRAQSCKIKVEMRIEKLMHPEVFCSPEQLLRILEHILDNAIKYNKPGGMILLACREMSGNDRLATYEFTVEDTGIGMRPEFLEKVFEMFEQENNEARTQYMGTGLGMAIVKNLVEQMDGSIKLESKPNVGTKVVFTLPLQVVAEDKKKDTKVDGIELTGKKVLLVEDNELNMEITQFILENAGMIVVSAVNGQEALEVFRASKVGEFHVILMDIMMPVLNGLEAAKAIRNLDRADVGTIPIIALSANVMDSDVRKSKMAGIDEHLAKPVDANQLLNTISGCLQK